MAALTASATYRESNGSLTLYIATFSSVSTAGDTWASGIAGVYGYWANATSGGAVGAQGINVSLSGSTFTLYSTGDALPVTLFVLAKS